MTKIIDLYKKANLFADCVLMSLLVFGMRLFMANIFWKSGVTKYNDLNTAILLFENEYKVPFISPEIATYLATSAELICPLLLVIGLGSRVAAMALLIMTAVIQFTYLQLETHYFWGMIFAIIAFYGPGKISLDYLLKKKIFSTQKLD